MKPEYWPGTTKGKFNWPEERRRRGSLQGRLMFNINQRMKNKGKPSKLFVYVRLHIIGNRQIILN